MKQILIILSLFASVTTFAQSPRIKLNQITKDSLTGSVLISSPTDSGMVYSRDLFISYGADTVLILGGDTLAATSGIISSVLSDGVTITGDGTSGNELKVDTATVISTIQGLVDTLSNYVTLSGTETITGAKTFTSALTQSGGNVNFDSGTLFVDENEDRVGIGTSSPSRRFEVNRVNNIEPFVVFRGVYDSIISQIYPDGVQEWNLTGNGGRVTYGTPGGNIGIVLYNDSVSLDTEFGLVNTTDYFNLRFTIDAGPAGLYIKKGGYVGVGTDSPLYDLDVNGNQRLYTSGVDGLLLEATTGSESPNIIFLSTANRYNIDNSNGTLRFFREDTGGGNGAVRMSLTDGGDLGIGTSPSVQLELSTDGAKKLTTTTWATGSDRRIKKNIVNYEKGLNEILQLNPVEYELNGKANTINGAKAIGLIAQEVQPIIPEAITGYYGKLNPDDESDTYLYNINTHSFFFMFINAFKTQQAIIDQQATQIEELKTQIQLILSEIEQLKNN